MDAATRKYIKELVQDIIDAYGLSDVETLVDKMGGAVITTSEYDTDRNAMVKKTGEHSFLIRVHPSDDRNLAIARGLGHILLHMGFLTDRERWEEQTQSGYHGFATAEEECQANEFAWDLLMPEQEIVKAIDEHRHGNYINIRKIAERFCVPPSAVISRCAILLCRTNIAKNAAA